MRTVLVGITLVVTAFGLLGLSPAATRHTPGATTVTIQSTVPTYPVRFIVHGVTPAVQIVADSVQADGDSLVVVTPARLTVGDAVARVVVRTTPRQPWLAVYVSSDSSRVEAWGDQVVFTRDAPTAALTIMAPTMRSTRR